MKLSALDYDLPEEKIAKFAPEVRGTTRLLVCSKNDERIDDDYYAKLDQYLMPGDVVVLNNTRVIPARLTFYTSSGRKIELLLTEKHGVIVSENTWNVMYRGKLQAGDILKNEQDHIAIIDEILGNGLACVSFSQHPLSIAKQTGKIPIPPYFNRDQVEADVERYQTQFALHDGSVAAPTASLNFTSDLILRLEKKGVIIQYITLHVGLGTFLPVRSDDTEEHTMHSEYFEVATSVLDTVKNAQSIGKKVLAVGTTVVRALEYIFANNLENSEQNIVTGEANIFITPGFKFQACDMILTNFHAPRSTPLLLVCAALSIQKYHQVYAHALSRDYQFLSYGDSMLITNVR